MAALSCPSCAALATSGAWFCAVCGEQLESEAEILGRRSEEGAGAILGNIIGTSGERSEDATATDESSGPPRSGTHSRDPERLGSMTIADITDTVAWEPDPAMFLQSEALILGELSASRESGGGIETYEGVVGTSDGGTESVVIYTHSHSSQKIVPGAVLRRTESGEGEALTPYEGYLLEEIDGRRTISQIESAGLLSPYELNVSLLTLLDRGLVEPAPAASIAIDIEVEEAPPPAPGPAPSPAPPRGSILPSRPVSITRSAPEDEEPIVPSRRRERERHSDPPSDAHSRREGRKMEKAERLYEAALRDQAEGNLVSARMNLKLALAFSPEDERLQGLFAQLTQTRAPPKNRPTLRHPQAQAYFEAATKAEAAGDVNRTVELLEKALKHGEEAAVCNRLGVILAMKKKEFNRAQQLLERATELDPKNPAYLHNLSKVLALHATSQEHGRDSAPPQTTPGGFWRWLRRLRPSS